MPSGREEQFFKLSSCDARLYDRLGSTKMGRSQVTEIATDLTTRILTGRLLEIGFGTGRLLREIHWLNRDIDLYGIDISKAMVGLAKKNLTRIPVRLYQGNVIETSFPADFFDIGTCTGSLYLWEQPEIALNEIYRILKPNGSAFLYETYQDYDKYQFSNILKESLKDDGLIMRWVESILIKQQLKASYKTSQIKTIISNTQFKDNYEIEKITLSNLPIWLRIKLLKKDKEIGIKMPGLLLSPGLERPFGI